MKASDYNRLRDYRLVKLGAYTGNTYQLNAYQGLYEIVRIGERHSEHGTHGGKFHSRADAITALDAMIYAIETVLGINTNDQAAAMVAAIHRASHNAHHTEAATGVYRQQVKANL